ncbi:MAG TPA: LPS export ABC transporter periplasmic protein LptC [Chitinophagales bacterium]|nr:LPS export ABC transporter periplasmic protein LptC [Chitinophagales bacterium]
MRALLLLFIFSSCAPDMEKVNQISAENASLTERGEDVEIQYSEEGKLRAKISAPLVATHNAEEPYMEFTKGLKLNFFDDELNVTSKLAANYGIYFTKKEEMMVRDDVVIVNAKGEMLNTEELTWRRKDEKLYSGKFVRITTPEEIIYGTGFEAKQDFSDYTIKNISGIVHLEKGKVN